MSKLLLSKLLLVIECTFYLDLQIFLLKLDLNFFESFTRSFISVSFIEAFGIFLEDKGCTSGRMALYYVVYILLFCSFGMFLVEDILGI